MSNLDNKIKQERLKEDFLHYKKVLTFMEANIPIQALCLPAAIENILLREGLIRAYDLIGHDLSKIKGLGTRRLDILTHRLDEFFSMCI